MKIVTRLLVLLAVLAVLAAGLVAAYREMRQERDQEASAETPVLAPSRAERGTNGLWGIKLDPEAIGRLGLKTTRLQPAATTRRLTVQARVLDGAPLAGNIHDIRAAEAAWEGARADLQRKQALYQNGRNATLAAVETAESLLREKQIAVETARDRVVAAWGKDLVADPNLYGLARSLLEREAALVRIEIPATEKPVMPPEQARLMRPNHEPLTIAKVLGPARSLDSDLVGAAYLGMVRSNASVLVPGALLLAELETGENLTGMALPRAAVVRYKGAAWIYEESAPQTFTRRQVPLDQPHPDGWLVPGEWLAPVVIGGAQSLLSEELKGAIQLRD